MVSVPTAIRPRVISRPWRRPNRSITVPSTSAPMGRMAKPTPNTLNEAISARNGSALGK